MFETMQKNFFKKSLGNGAFLVILGLVIIIFTAKYAWGAVTGYTKLSDLNPDELKQGKLVEIEVADNGGTYQTNSSTSTYYYCATTEMADGYYYFIGLSVGNNSQIRSSLSDVAKTGEPATLYGKLAKMEGTELSSFEKRVTKLIENAYGITTFDMDLIAVPYRVTVFNSKLSYDVIGGLLFLLGVWFIFMAVLNICKTHSGANLKKLKADLAVAGLSEADAEADYNRATLVTKKDTFRIGYQCIYYQSGYSPRALPATHLVWAYQNTVTQRRNGIKVNTTYSIVLNTDGTVSSTTVTMPNELSAQDALKAINARFPWVVTGYSEDLRRIYTKDRQQFLNMRFNAIEHIPVEPETENTVTTETTDN